MASIRKRGNSYQLIAFDGYDRNGKQVKHTKTWRIPPGMSEKKAAKEAMNAALLFEQEVHTGMVADAKGIKLCDFADKWFTEYASTQLAPLTAIEYKNKYLRYIDPALGHVYINKIQPVMLLHFYNELKKPVPSGKCHCICDFKVDILQARNLTKTELHKQSEVSIYVLNSLTLGRNISIDCAHKIADTLAMRFDAIFEPTEPKVLSNKTILHIHRLLSVILQTAVYWQLIPQNPCSRTKPPKITSTKTAVFDKESAIRVLELLENEPIRYQAAVTTSLFVGTRRGELLGLTWADVDFDKHLISINKSILYTPQTGTFQGETKNVTSYRTIKVPQAVLDSLLKYRADQEEILDAFGIPWDDHRYIFSWPNGKPWNPNTITAWFKNFLRRNGFPEELHLHSCRHTCASLLLANGTAVPTVSGQLGHASPAVTMKVYAHTIQSAQAEAADLLGDILTPPRKNSD